MYRRALCYSCKFSVTLRLFLNKKLTKPHQINGGKAEKYVQKICKNSCHSIGIARASGWWGTIVDKTPVCTIESGWI